MRGSYHFRVKSKKVLFEFTIRRNITVIKGDSATGKTTLLHMLYEYLRVGKQSGYSVSTNADYYVYMRREVGRSWEEAIGSLKNTIIFIEENNEFVFSRAFAEYVKKSGNYFVLVNRASLRMLPYSIHEIYEMITDRKHVDVKESYHYLSELYSNYPITENNKLKNVVTEDSNSGHQFFARFFKHSNVVSAGGNSNILSCVQSLDGAAGDVLVIVDGAAFGAMIESCLEYFEVLENRRVSIWMPESFEYLILQSGLFGVHGFEHVLAAPSDYVESEKYESWERYFTQLLISLTMDKAYKYSKNNLNEYYVQDKNMQKIARSIPEQIKKNMQ